MVAEETLVKENPQVWTVPGIPSPQQLFY